MTTPAPHDPNYGRLEQRVSTIETSIDKIGASINALADKFDNRSRTPWPVLVSGGLLLVALLGVIGTAWKAPIDNIIARQEFDLRSIESAIVPRVEHEYHWQVNKDIDAETARRLERIEGAVFQPQP